MYGASLPLSILAATLLVIGFPRWLVKNQVVGESGGRYWNVGLHIALALPFLALLSRFLVADVSYHYVWLHGGENLPFRYRFAAVWAAREGPLLLWAGLIAFLSWMGRNPGVGESERQSRTRLALLHGITLVLLLLAAGLDPFRKTANPDWTAPGLNALLQTDLMVIHPPLIFLFYSICMVIGATALATLLCSSDGTSGLRERLLNSARPAVLFGVLSIGLGGLWAYTVLDWGGYWAWDPVETGSLLPWLAVVILLHLPLRPGRVSDGIYMASGLAVAGFAIFATMVTRASGVWASSVHTFVTAEDASLPSDAWGRLLSLVTDTTAGVEVISYLLVLMLLASILSAWLLADELGQELPARLGWTMAVVPLSACAAWLFIEEDTALWGGTSGAMIGILGILPLLISTWFMRVALWKRLTQDPVRLPLLFGAILVAYWNGDVILGGLGVVLMLILVTRSQPESEVGWITAGIVFHLFSAWAQLAELTQSGAAMALFLVPMFINEPPAGDDAKSIFSRGGQMRVVFQTPSTMVALYLLLSWTLLLNSLDRTQLEAHELYGAPIIVLLSTGLLVYGWRGRVEPKSIPWLLGCLAALSGLLAWGFADTLPGDVDDVFAGPLTRGQLAWIMLPAVLLTVPALGLEVLTRGRKWWRLRQGGGRGSPARQMRTSRAALAGMGAHLVHLGLLILIIGHIFATTLVDRGNISHRLSLSEDNPVIEGDLVLVFTDIELLSVGDEEFDSRFDVGVGYVGAVVEIYEVGDSAGNTAGSAAGGAGAAGSGAGGADNAVILGDYIATLQPGVLRFENGFARSEVATMSRASGDFILIFDLSQASELGQAMVMGDLDEVDRIRVTAYDLPGSHLVWLGWSLMLLGMMLNWQSWWPAPAFAVTKQYSTSGDGEGRTGSVEEE